MVCLLFRKMGRDVINKSNIQIKNIKVIDNRNRMRNFQNRETKKEKKKNQSKRRKKKSTKIQGTIISIKVFNLLLFF